MKTLSEIELSIDWLRREKKWREREEPTDYIDTAIQALQEKQERENQKPLSLDKKKESG